MGVKSYKEEDLKADVYCPHNKCIKPASRAFMQSLKKTNDFKIVYQSGKYYTNTFFVMYVKKNGLTNSRLGISASKKVGNAVVRNKIKRIIKEICRIKRHDIKSGFDIIIVTRSVVGSLSRKDMFQLIENSIGSLFQRQGLLVK